MRADEVKDLGLPTYRAKIIRHSTRRLIRLPAFRRIHFYHAFEPVIPPTTPGVLSMSGPSPKSRILHSRCFPLRGIHTLHVQLTPIIRPSFPMLSMNPILI
jgi:hypothetical protein